MKYLREFLGKAKSLYGQTVATLSDRSKPFYIQNLVASLVIAFFATSALYISRLDRLQNLSYTDLAFVSAQHIGGFLLTTLTVMAILIAVSCLLTAERILPVALVLSVTAFCFFLQVDGYRNVWLAVGMAVVVFICCRWLFSRFEAPFSQLKLSFGTVKVLVGLLFVIFVGNMSLMGVCRYYSFSYNAFDFGIFAQMFGYMKETGLPFTTVERNQYLSHFAVHFSPFFYVLMPGYLLFPTPAYLCVVQTLFVGAGVFAVYGIAKTLGFSPKQTLLVSALFLLYPSMSFGLYYDFHENKFLTFCILYAVYFLLKRKFVPFYIFAFLLCTIKEDAAIYLVAIALFMLFHERLIRHGLITLGLALIYFVFALKMINVCGALEDMQFGYRYSNFELNGEISIGSIIKVTILDFGYALSQMFQQEKMEFLLWMFLPVFFMPFMTKKVSTLLLLTPMLLVNLMTNWIYQHDVDYQYTYGTAALILICTLLVLQRLSPQKRNMLLLAAVMLSTAVTVPRVVERNQYYISAYTTDRQQFEESMQFLDDNLSKNSVIGVESDVMPVLYDYPHLYLDPHSDELAAKVEYFVTKMDDQNIGEMLDRGFEFVTENGYVGIYKNPNYQPG